jgi:hypothetical protein
MATRRNEGRWESGLEGSDLTDFLQDGRVNLAPNCASAAIHVVFGVVLIQYAF